LDNTLTMGLDDFSFLREDRSTLADNFYTTFFGFSLDGIIFLDTTQKFFVATGTTHVFNTNVDSLAQLTIADNLGNFNTNSRSGHVENNTSATVIQIVGHTLVVSGINLDVNIVSDSVIGQVTGEGGDTLGTGGLGEFVSGTSTETETVRHLDGFLKKRL